MLDMYTALLQYSHKLLELSPVILSIFIFIGKQTKSFSRIWIDLESREHFEQVSENEMEMARRVAKDTEISLHNPFLVTVAIYPLAAVVMQFIIANNELLSFVNSCMMLPILALVLSTFVESLGGYSSYITPKIGLDGHIVFVRGYRREISMLLQTIIFIVSSGITWRALWPGPGQKAAEGILCIAFIFEIGANASGDFVLDPRLDKSLRANITSPFVVFFFAAIFAGRVSGRFFGYETGFGHITPWVWMSISAIMIEMDTSFLFMVYRFDHHRGISSNARLPATHFYFWPVVTVFCTVLVASPAVTVFTRVDFNVFNFSAIVVPFAGSFSAFACHILAKARGHSTDLKSYQEHWPKMLEDEMSDRKAGEDSEARSLKDEKKTYMSFAMSARV